MRTARYALVLGLWVVAAALLVGREGKLPAFTPSDFKYDFISAYWISQGRPAEALDRTTADALGDRLGTPPGPYWEGAPAQTHPPPSALLVRPLVPLGFRAAALVWLAFSLALLGVLASLLTALWQRSDRLPSLARCWPLAVALCLWPPSLFEMTNGQWSILLTAFVTAGWWCYERGSGRAAAGWLAAAAAVKVTPAVLLPYLAIRDRRLAIRIVIAAVVIVAVAWPFTGGVGAWRQFIRGAGDATPIFEGWIHNTASVRGIFVRLFVPSRFADPVVALPALGHVLATGTSVALVAIAAWFALRRARPVDPTSAAIWLCLIPLLNPLSWHHNVLMLLLPATLLARAPTGHRWRPTVIAVLAILTIPYEALWYLAGHRLPLPAARSWILGLPALAGLLLFGTACRASRTAREPRSD